MNGSRARSASSLQLHPSTSSGRTGIGQLSGNPTPLPAFPFAVSPSKGDQKIRQGVADAEAAA